MCGIVAVFGNISVAHEKVFKNMLVFDQVRGEHSTGICAVTKNDNEPEVVKVVGTPENLFDTNSFTKVMGKSNRVLIGHNRWATVGKINRENAHPFVCGDIVGVHNGSLRGYTQLDGHGQFAVDSHVLYNHISRHGLRDALEKTFGAMALVWWNRADATLNFYRNDDRPLFYATTTDGGVGFLASEAWMIHAACSRNSVAVSEIKSVPIHQLATVHLPMNKFTGGLEKVSVQQIDSRKEVVASAYYSLPSANRKTTYPEAYPQDVVITHTGEEIILYKNHYYEFFEETVDAKNSRTFVLAKGLMPNGVKLGDSFRINSTGKIRDGNDSYYVVSPHGMTKVGSNFSYTAGVTDEEDDKGGVTTFVDNKGKSIPRADWMRQFGTCSYCNGDVDPEAQHKFNTSGGCYCDECLTNPVTRDLLPR